MRHDGPQLLTREEFRKQVFERDGHRCVVCSAKEVPLDAHHIMERRLFTAPHEFGGYFLDNGVTLCDQAGCIGCHLLAEQTVISPEQLRELAGIKRIILPEHLYGDRKYSKWGDVLLSGGRRAPGELFHDESVRKVLGKLIDSYVPYIEYPRTYHLPWSGKVVAGKVGDDKVLPKNFDGFLNRRVIVTAKMDGQNCTMYDDYMHARTTDFKSSEDWHWLQGFHAAIRWDIPKGWRVCCENLYLAKEITYQHLTQYVQAFSVWDRNNYCLNWDDTLWWMSVLDTLAKESGYARGFPTVSVLYDGIWTSNFEKEVAPILFRPEVNGDSCEGYVIRIADQFHYSQFRNSVAKFVRADHEPKHGRRHGGKLITNELEQIE